MRCRSGRFVFNETCILVKDIADVKWNGFQERIEYPSGEGHLSVSSLVV